MKTLSLLDFIALILVIIGGINWGLVGLLHVDLVAAIFGDMTLLAKVIYVLVGLAAVYVLILTLKLKGMLS